MEPPNKAYDQMGLYERIKRRQGDYEGRREQYDAQRDVICELLRPDLVKGKVGDKDEGAFSSSAIVEGTGPWAALVWQRGFQGNMISRKSEWFRDRLQEPPKWTKMTFEGNDEVNQYQQDLTDHMTAVYQRSNYYDVMPEFILNAGTVGSPAMLFQYDIANDRMVCQVPDYASVWLDKDIFGYDNAIHVKWEWTALQAEEMFGINQLPGVVQQQLRNGNHYEKTNYLQCIYGAGDRIYKGLDEVRQNRPWLEHFICLSATGENEFKVLHPLNKGPGYFTRPFSTWHYHRNWHEVYGRSMGWWAVYDLRGHNAMWEALFGEAELAIRPPTWAMGSLKGVLDLSPGGSNWANNAQEYEAVPVHLERKSRYDVAIDFADRLKAAIERHYHVSFFMAVNQAIMSKKSPETAFALMRAENENAGQLAPEVETYENQVLSHTHDVFIDYERLAEPAYPWGRLPEPPEIAYQFSRGEVEPEFIGQLSMAQLREREILKFYRAIGTAETIFSAAPETINKIRWPQALERILEAQDFPQTDIVPEDEYEQVTETVRQRALQQQMMENAPGLAQGVKNLQGKTEQGSPLAMMGGRR